MTGQRPIAAPSIPNRQLGLPMLRFIQEAPLAAAAHLQRRFGDVARLNILFRRIYYFFTPEAARQILVDHHSDVTREARLLKIFESFQGKNVVTSEGTLWEQQRRILAPGFSPKRVSGYINLMQAAIDDSVREELPVEAGHDATLDADFLTTRITMDVILRTLFSHVTNSAEATGMSVAIRGLTRQSMREVFWPLVPPNWLPYPGRTTKLGHIRTLDSLITRQIAERTADPARIGTQGDVLDMMLAARDDQPEAREARLSPQQIHDNCLMLFSAGFDTASSALTWWIGLMATHPDVVARVRREIDDVSADDNQSSAMSRLPYLNATIKEAMRLYPPSTALFTRVALRDLVICDTPVPRGTLVAIPIWNLHHDERSFPDPETFNPDRFMPDAPPIPRSAFMPFGAGPHFCLGQHFAYTEMAIIAAHLITHFEMALADSTTLPEPTVDVALKPETPLRVRFTRRSTSRP